MKNLPVPPRPALTAPAAGANAAPINVLPPWRTSKTNQQPNPQDAPR